MSVHWLEVGGMHVSLSNEGKQWNLLYEYIKKYPDSNIKVFYKTSGKDLFAKVVRLECNQKYADLDLDCNSCSDVSIRRLTYKPKGMEVSKLQLNDFCKILGGE